MGRQGRGEGRGQTGWHVPGEGPSRVSHRQASHHKWRLRKRERENSSETQRLTTEAREARLLPFQADVGGQEAPESRGGGPLTLSCPSRLEWGQARQSPACSSFPPSRAKETLQGSADPEALSRGLAVCKMPKDSSGCSTARQKHELGRGPRSRV